MQTRGQNDPKYPFLPDHIWKQMSKKDETRHYIETWSNKKDAKPSKGISQQYPRLNKAKNDVKTEPKNATPGDTLPTNGQIWRPGGPPQKVKTFPMIRRFSFSTTHPILDIHSNSAPVPDVTAYEETNSNDGSFHTPSTAGKDSDL
jgi:hypothetical protein